MMYNTKTKSLEVRGGKMQFSLFLQINFILLGLVGLLFCTFGYKFARFLLPLCGMIVIESALYLFVGGFIGDTDLTGVLFYGGTAVASYIVLFFVLRLSGFFTGVLGAGLLSYFVITAFGLSGSPFVFPVFASAAVLAGLLGFVYSRVGVIIASVMFGSGIAAAFGTILILAPKAEYAKELSITAGFTSVVNNNPYIFFAVFALLLLVGLVVQLRVTGQSQILVRRINISLEQRKTVSE